MRFIETELWLALKARIDTLVTDPVMEIFEPGATFTPPSDGDLLLPFILTSDARNEVQRIGIDPKLQVRSGTLILSVQWPVARPVTHAQIVQIAGGIAAHFPADTRMKIGSTCLRVTRDPDVTQPYRDGPYLACPTRIAWSTV